MALIAIIYAVLLIVLGVGGYIVSQGVSVTALIPAFFGIPLLICGFLALKEHYLKHAMHAAAVLGLLGFLGSVRGLLILPRLLGGGEVTRPMAVVSQSIMALLSLIFIVLCIRSFVVVRRNRALTQK